MAGQTTSTIHGSNGGVRLMAIVALSQALYLSGCSDQFMASKDRSKTSDVASLTGSLDSVGNLSSSIDPTSGSTQVLRMSSGSLSGSAIAIPAGALSIPVTITVGSGETLASSSFTDSLGITDNSVTASGPSVSFSTSTAVEASTAFTLSIPTTSSSSLDLSGDPANLVIMAKWIKVTNGVASYVMGIIPGNQATIGTSTVSFPTKNFGVYQAATAKVPITSAVQQPTLVPPAPAADAKNPLVGTWAQCKSVNPVPAPAAPQGPPPAPKYSPSPAPDTLVSTDCNNYSCSLAMTVSFINNYTASDRSLTTINDQSFPSTSSFYLSQGTSQVLSFTPSATPNSNHQITLQAPDKCHFKYAANNIVINFQDLAFIHQENAQTPIQPGVVVVPATSSIMSVDASTTIVCDGTTTSNYPQWFKMCIQNCTPPPPAAPVNYTGNSLQSWLGNTQGVTYSTKEVANLTSTNFTHVMYNYPSTDCTGTLVSSYAESGTYNLPTVDIPGTIPIDITTTNVGAQILTADGITAATNNPQFAGCGLSNWKISTQRDLTGSSCFTSSGTHYTRFKIDGSHLFACDDHNSSSSSNGGSSASARSDCSGIDPTSYMTKQ